MLMLPYILFQSPPIGPIALTALTSAHYPPAYVIDDPKLSVEEQLELIEEYRPTFLLVVGYGALLKQAVLDTVAGQVINLHPSLLPAYRGPAPVVQAILDGVSETGITVIEIDAQMDHGPILAQASQPLHGKETPEELYNILITKGVELFIRVIDDYLEERLDGIPQNHSEATFTSFIRKQDGKLDFSKPADQLEREIRALQGWPKSWVEWEGKRLIIHKAHVQNNTLVFEKVQPENGKIMSFSEFCLGQRCKPEDFYNKLHLD